MPGYGQIAHEHGHQVLFTLGCAKPLWPRLVQVFLSISNHLPWGKLEDQTVQLQSCLAFGQLFSYRDGMLTALLASHQTPGVMPSLAGSSIYQRHTLGAMCLRTVAGVMLFLFFRNNGTWKHAWKSSIFESQTWRWKVIVTMFILFDGQSMSIIYEVVVKDSNFQNNICFWMIMSSSWRWDVPIMMAFWWLPQVPGHTMTGVVRVRVSQVAGSQPAFACQDVNHGQPHSANNVCNLWCFLQCFIQCVMSMSNHELIASCLGSGAKLQDPEGMTCRQLRIVPFQIPSGPSSSLWDARAFFGPRKVSKFGRSSPVKLKVEMMSLRIFVS